MCSILFTLMSPAYYSLVSPHFHCFRRLKAKGRPWRYSSPHTNWQRSFVRVRPWGFQPQQRSHVIQQQSHSFTRRGRKVGQRAVAERGRRSRPVPPAQTATLSRELQLQHEVPHAWVQLTRWGHSHCCVCVCVGLRSLLLFSFYVYSSLFSFYSRASDWETWKTFLYIWMSSLSQSVCWWMQGT